MKKIYAAVIFSSLNLSMCGMETPDLENGKKDIRRTHSMELQSISQDFERGWREDLFLRLDAMRAKMDEQSQNTNDALKRINRFALTGAVVAGGTLASTIIWGMAQAVRSNN